MAICLIQYYPGILYTHVDPKVKISYTAGQAYGSMDPRGDSYRPILYVTQSTNQYGSMDPRGGSYRFILHATQSTFRYHIKHYGGMDPRGDSYRFILHVTQSTLRKHISCKHLDNKPITFPLSHVRHVQYSYTMVFKPISYHFQQQCVSHALSY